MDLVDRKALTTSLVVAEYFGKDHFHVLRDIDHLVAELNVLQGGASNFGGALVENHSHPMFEETKHLDASNQYRRMYTMNRDAFDWLTPGLASSPKATKFILRRTTHRESLCTPTSEASHS